MMPYGWFKTPRTLLQGPIWSHHNAARLAVYALGAAAWQPTEWKDGRQRLTVPVNAFMTSRSRLATQCGLSPQEVRTGLKQLENHGFIRTRKTKLWTMITLLDPMVCGENEAPANQQPSNQPTQPPKTNQVKNSASDYKQTTCAEPSRTINQAEAKNQPSEPPAKEEGKELLKEGGGENPRFADAAAAPPRPLAFNPTQPDPPRATVEPPAAPAPDGIAALVHELAQSHDGDVAFSFAVDDARKAFRQSGATDEAEWCNAARVAHQQYLSNPRRKQKSLGFWFADGCVERYSRTGPTRNQSRLIELGGPDPHTNGGANLEAKQPARRSGPAACAKCGGNGKILTPGYSLPMDRLDEPGFDPEKYFEEHLVPCTQCAASNAARCA